MIFKDAKHVQLPLAPKLQVIALLWDHWRWQDSWAWVCSFLQKIWGFCFLEPFLRLDSCFQASTHDFTYLWINLLWDCIPVIKALQVSHLLKELCSKWSHTFREGEKNNRKMTRLETWIRLLGFGRGRKVLFSSPPPDPCSTTSGSASHLKMGWEMFGIWLKSCKNCSSFYCWTYLAETWKIRLLKRHVLSSNNIVQNIFISCTHFLMKNLLKFWWFCLNNWPWVCPS